MRSHEECAVQDGWRNRRRGGRSNHKPLIDSPPRSCDLEGEKIGKRDRSHREHVHGDRLLHLIEMECPQLHGAAKAVGRLVFAAAGIFPRYGHHLHRGLTPAGVHENLKSPR